MSEKDNKGVVCEGGSCQLTDAEGIYSAPHLMQNLTVHSKKEKAVHSKKEIKVKFIKKRNGTIDRFREEKVRSAIEKAVKQVHLESGTVDNIMNQVYRGLERFNGAPPTISEIEEVILESTRNVGYEPVAKAYEFHRDKRTRVRETLAVISETSGRNSTDNSLLIRSGTEEVQGGFDSTRIKKQLMEEANLSEDLAKTVVKRVDGMIVDLYDRGMTVITTNTIRELVDISMGLEGLGDLRRKQALLGIPTKNLETLLFSKNQENSNVAANNSEAVREAIAEVILKQYALENVFSPEVADAHTRGDIHIHDMGYPERVYCSAHSIEYLKKYGLNKGLPNLEAKSGPSKSAAVLNGHVQTFLASKQADYAGALGFGFVNILYSSLINRPVDVVKGTIDNREITIEEEDLKKLIKQGIYQTKDPKGEGYFKETDKRKELRELTEEQKLQIAQELIFSASQNAFSRGGQTLFIDFNIHTGVPNYMRGVPVIGPGGKYVVQMPDGSVKQIKEVPRFRNPENPQDLRNGDADSSQLEKELAGGKILTYGDLEPTAQRFTKSLLDVWRTGDKDGRPFHFPKADLHISDSTFTNKNENELFDYAAQIASEHGGVYFMFDRGEDAVLAQCCRLKEKIEDASMLKYPEKLRFTGFQNVTVNLARCAYKGRNLEGTLNEIDKAMELALDAHRQKRDHIQRLLDDEGGPLRGAGRPCDDGNPYITLDNATYIFGVIGMNETVQYLTNGQQLHESEEAYRLGLKINAHMFRKIKEIKNKAGFKCTIEETPAESTTRRFAKIDWQDPVLGETARKYIKGTKENPYYTNSIHFSPDANVGIADRIVGQSKFHQMIASGAMVHAWVGEHRPNKDTIKSIIERTHKNTFCSQLCFSPTYTECDSCGNIMNGEKELCENENCPNSNEETMDPKTISPVTRIVGYNSRTKHWNGSQQQIYEDRKKAQEYYAGLGEPRDMGWLYSPTIQGLEKTVIMQFAKHNCPGCETTESEIREQLKLSGLEENVEFRKLYIDEYDRDTLTDATMYDASLETFPTVVVQGPRGIWKKTANYAKKDDGSTDPVTGVEVLDQVKSIGGYAIREQASK